jgi:uncharacterized protein YkwD
MKNMKKLLVGLFLVVFVYSFTVIAGYLYQQTTETIAEVRSTTQLGQPLDPLMPSSSDEVCPNQLNSKASVAQQQRAMFCLINNIRIKYGVKPLPANQLLNESAAAKAQAIVKCQQFSHDACGKPFIYFFNQTEYTACDCFWGAGENLAWAGNSDNYSSTESPRALANAWLNSPPHRKAMLSPEWTDQGLALIKTPFNEEKYSVVWVSHFGFQR